MSYVSR